MSTTPIVSANPQPTLTGATALNVVTIVFSDPELNGSQNFQRINSSLSFSYLLSWNIRTLSASAVDPGTDVVGLLYTPDLPHGDPCIKETTPYVPANVTRRSNLPSMDYDLVALAPWVNADCTLKYLASARQDPIRAFMFFLPSNSTADPPEPDSNIWNLGKDESHWKSQNHFPVYAIPGESGQKLLTASALYIQNMTDVPHGHALTEFNPPMDYVRLFVDIDTGGGTTLPSLWIFLLVVLGILLAVIGLTSLCMHWLQRRRRQALRRRVANGEVDLEALGIKRLTVPQEILDEMPLYTYGSGAPVPPTAARDANAAEVGKENASPQSSRPSSPQPTTRATPAVVRSSGYRPSPLSQPTCAICLDDFVPAGSNTDDGQDGQDGTIVRELPCHHIFHPECVDTFLRDSSSLCPMCKKSALPKGYCPRVVTNAMVRRERMVRRIRPQATPEDEEMGSTDGDTAPPMRMASRLRSFSNQWPLRQGRRISSATVQPSSNPRRR